MGSHSKLTRRVLCEKNRSELLIRNLACFETGPEGPGLEGQQRKINLRSQSGAHARLVRTGTVKQ